MIPREVESYIRPEDLPSEDLKDLALLCGMEVAIKLLKHFEGRNVYFPLNWTKEFRKKWVSQHWNGENSKELGAQLNVSFSTIYRLVNGPKFRGGPLVSRRPANPEQLDLLK